MDKATKNNMSQSSILEPINLHSTSEFDELLRQRVLCGWEKCRSQLESWRTAIDAQIISMFWIVPHSHSQISAPQRYAGHIAMKRKIEPADDKLGHGPVHLQHIWNVFILPEHRSSGLGQAAFRAVEALATVEPYGSPECEAITLNTVSRRYIEDDGEEWRGFYKKLCDSLKIELPAKGRSNEDWYARMGFVKWKEEPAYAIELDGNRSMLIAAWMRKELV
jgi:ribosomal protein S18 acetylase RimI-like enzyme